MEDIQLIHGEALEEMDKLIERGVIVDAIICDLPYGITACKWDTIIPFEPMWERLNKLIKQNGAIVLFGSEPFSSALRMSNLKMYKYDWKWHKDKCSNFIHAKTQPRKTIEDIMIFTKGGTTHNSKEKYIYNSQMTDRAVRKKTKKTKKSEHQKEIRNDKTIFESSVNFIAGKNYAEANIYFKTDHKGRVHPTQKPVALMEYLVKTYTNEDELVLDFTMGSGTTGLACKNLNRKFIGIELDEKYYNIAKERLNKEEK